MHWQLWYQKHCGDKNLKHLFSALRTGTYGIVEDWVGNLYWGINLEWNYGKHWVDITMPIYKIKYLTRYNHLPLLNPQHCPYTLNPITYHGKDNQATNPSGTSPLLDASSKKRMQKIVGSFLYYTCAVDPTILMALSAITAKQSAPTDKTLAHVSQFLD